MDALRIYDNTCLYVVRMRVFKAEKHYTDRHNSVGKNFLLGQQVVINVLSYHDRVSEMMVSGVTCR